MVSALKKAFFKNPRKVLPQVLATCVAAIGFLGTGFVRGWASAGVPSMAESGLFNVTASDKAWITSIPPLGAFFGSLMSGPCLQYLGRKITLILVSIPLSLGFVVIGFATYGGIGVVYAGRSISALAIGMTVPASQIYVSECSSPRIRGALGSITALWLALGILLSYIIGAFVPWDHLSWISSVFPAMLGVGILFFPETPGWLLGKGKEDEAKKALQRLRGSHTDVGPELEKMKKTVNDVHSTQKIGPKDLLKKPVLVPFGLSLALMLFQQFSGINAVIFYTVTIFQEAGGSVNRHLATIIVGLVQFLSTFLSLVLVDKAGRRVLLMVSGSLMALALAGMGSFFYVKETQGKDAASAIGWLPLTSLVVFIFAFSIGFNNVPFLIMGEILPTRFRSLLAPLSSSFNLIMTFVVVRTFPIMSTSMGAYGAFWFYMCCCFCAVIFVYFLLPETKGKTLDEIEKLFTSRQAIGETPVPLELEKIDNDNKYGESKTTV